MRPVDTVEDRIARLEAQVLAHQTLIQKITALASTTAKGKFFLKLLGIDAS